MADHNVAHVADNSPEEVAYKLFKHIVDAENRVLHHKADYGEITADRKWILDTYAEALRTVQNPGHRFS